jgi:hypothetical protein
MHARRIRISFNDPDATDSDSGDDASSVKTETVILIGKMALAAGSKVENLAGPGSKAQAAAGFPAAASGKKRGVKAAERPVPKRRHRGVYERQPGRWVAEFRSHRLKARHWLGTYPTEEEARAAYDSFEASFLSQPGRGGPPASSAGGGGGSRDVHRAASHPTDDKRPTIVLALMSATTLATGPSATTAKARPSLSSPPCISSLTTASPSPSPSPSPASQKSKQQAHADAPTSIEQFWEDVPNEEDLVGLADLSDLPLPFLDGNMDDMSSLGDLSLFDNGFL